MTNTVLATQAVELPRAEVIEITDSQTKRVYTVDIQLPRGYDQKKSYPIVDMTDSPYISLSNDRRRALSGGGGQ